LPNICLIAGEKSGDNHGAILVRELKILRPELNFYGLGGDELAAQGMELLCHIKDLNFMGFIEVIRHLPKIQRTMELVLREIALRKSELVVLIDYPGFNLKLAQKIKDGRFHPPPKIFYYISPQVWAWGSERIPQIARLIDRMAGILPFEQQTYAGSGLDFHFVGHPLLDEIDDAPDKETFFQENRLFPKKKLIALLPGSRNQEVKRILPAMLAAAEIIRSKIDCQFAIAAAETVEHNLFHHSQETALLHKQTPALMKYADLVLTKSGTSTLETAVTGTPMVVVYKMNPLTYLLGKRMVKIKNIALVNVVAGKTIVPELIQNQASPQKIAQTALNLLLDTEKYADMKLELAEVKKKLGAPGASRRAAELALDLIA